MEGDWKQRRVSLQIIFREREKVGCLLKKQFKSIFAIKQLLGTKKRTVLEQVRLFSGGSDHREGGLQLWSILNIC